jgi:hypothetical protein
MLNKTQKLIAAIIIAAIIITITVIIIAISNNNNKKQQQNTVIEDTKADSDVVVDKVTFSKITKVYDGGITNITAEMVNNTDTTKNFTIKIILKDNDGKEVKSMMQVVENLEPNRIKVFTTGIAGDYTSIKNIEFQVVEE